MSLPNIELLISIFNPRCYTFYTLDFQTMSDSVKVAVRVRPYISGIDGKQTTFKCGVKMGGPSTTVFNPDTNESKTFSFDYSFWSYDANDSHYVDNKKVYEALGQSVLDNAWAGYNISLFAYGKFLNFCVKEFYNLFFSSSKLNHIIPYFYNFFVT